VKNDRCKNYNEPTKYVFGFWDGFDPKTGESTSGYLYNCKSQTCPIRLEEIRVAARDDKEREAIRLKHKARGIDMRALDEARKCNEFNIRDIANHVGISAPLYCDYRECRKEIPQETYDKMKFLLGEG